MFSVSIIYQKNYYRLHSLSPVGLCILHISYVAVAVSFIVDHLMVAVGEGDMVCAGDSMAIALLRMAHLST